MPLRARVASKFETRMCLLLQLTSPFREMTLASHVRERGSRRSGCRACK